MPAPGATLPPFELHRPAQLSEAVALLERLGPEAHVYAGGTELLLVLRSGLSDARHLVDVKRLPGLGEIGRSDGEGVLRIGATATHARISRSPEVAALAPALVEAERRLGNVRVRTTGTLGGNLCFGEPHSDPATVLLAHDASVGLHGPRGARGLPLEEFMLGMLETARERDEILTHVDLPLRRRKGAAYLRFAAAERPTAGVAVLLDVADGRLHDVRIAAGCVGPRPLRLRAAEAAASELAPRAAKSEFDAVGAVAAGELDPVADGYGPADFKRRLAATLVSRALRQAAAQAS
jgi:carbon-monoxide dehydrogenase medium subunit